MKYRALGRTGLTVSEIGFGAWGIGGASHRAVAYGPTDDKESLRVLRQAFDLGVTFYDTADLYGDGRSEDLIGAAFKGIRRHVIIASKVGLVDATGLQNFSPDYIRTSLEGTLRRLRTDYLDLYQLHDPAMELLEQHPEVLETLRILQRSGKIRAFGISVRSPDDALVAVKRWSLECIQANMNLVDQRMITNGFMALCQSRAVGVIGRTPLCFGFLTGSYSAQTVFDELDHRSRWPADQRARWAEAHQLFASVKERRDQTAAQFALRFCLSYPTLSTVIPGILTEAHLTENVQASHLGPLEPVERLMVEQIYRQHRFFLGDAPRSATQERTHVGVS